MESQDRNKIVALAVVIAVAGAVVPVLLRLMPGGPGGGGSVGDDAMDDSFMQGTHSRPRPVHPPRGERVRERPSTGLEITSEPILCTGGGEVVRANVRLTVNAPRAAVVQNGCLLRLVNVDLTAADGVILESGRLEMTNGSITARGAAIRASGDATATLTNVRVQASNGVEASGQARITATGGAVRATGVSVVARGEAQVALSGTELEGPVAQDEGAQVTTTGGDDAPSDG